jgi:hypothetical protein
VFDTDKLIHPCLIFENSYIEQNFPQQSCNRNLSVIQWNALAYYAKEDIRKKKKVLKHWAKAVKCRKNVKQSVEILTLVKWNKNDILKIIKHFSIVYF